MKMHRVIFLIVLLSYSVLALSRPTILFSCSIAEYVPQWGMAVDIYTKAFDKLGYDFSMVYVNTKREQAEHKNERRYDGSCARATTFSEATGANTVVRVDVPVEKIVLSVWRHANIRSDTSDALFFQGAKVGYIRGNALSGLVVAEHAEIIPVSFLKPDLGLKTLSVGRIDYWVGFTFTSSFVIQQFNLDSSVIKTADLRSDYLYPFLNRKHSKIAVQLQTELQKIIDDRGFLIE